MAQIIKHRRGSLESVQSATKRAGELLVVTGSAGITANNGNSLLFIGIDGSTVTPSNKVLQGSTVPDLSGASYDTSIDGIPYYNTSTEKLYILNKAGNVEVKASANTGGTGIVSGSSQVTSLLPTGTVSGSSQVIGILGELNTFSASEETKNTTLGTYTGSVDSKLTNLINITGSYATTGSNLFIGNQNISGSFSLQDSSTSFQIQGNGFSQTYLTSNGAIVLNPGYGGVEMVGSNREFRLDTLYAAVTISGSITGIGNVALFSQSVDSRLDSVEASLGGGGSIGTRVTALEAFSGSQETKDSTLATYTGSVNTQLTELYSTASNHELRTDRLEVSQSANETFQSDVETAITLNGQNVTINGNLTVSGTQTIVDSTTVQIGDNIIELNGSAAANGGLLVKDATSPNTASGSLLWDSTNDYWKAGAVGSESKILRAAGDSVVSGSSQITISSTTGYSDFSSSIATAISASTAGSTWENLNGKPAGIVSGSSQVVSYLATQNVNLGGISGSSLDITGNAKIDGNVIIGGNITVGDADTDTVSFSADLTSDILVGTDNTYDLGSSSKGFANVYATNLYGSVNATNGVISGSSQVNADSITNFDTNVKDKLNADTVVSGSAQVIALLPTGVVSGSSQLNNTTISGATLTSVQASGSFSGSFQGDGSQLSGIASTLALSGSTGNDTLNLKTEALLVTGSNGISTNVASNTVTISGVDASTSNKGVASFSSDDFSVTTGNVSIKDGGVRAANLNSDVAGTGLSLDGVDNSLEVDYGSTTGTAVEGDTSLVVEGTTNEIEITNGSVTLGAGGTITVGLPNSVTIQTGSIAGDLSVGRNLTVTGNLFVEGTTTTVDSTTIQLGDNIIELNGSGASNGGLVVKDVTSPNTQSGSLLWDSTNDYWKAGVLGSEKEIVRLNATPTSGSVLVVGADGLLINSEISDTGTVVTIANDLVISGVDASAFLYSDSSKTISSVVPSNAGDIIQWNGSSFVASNTIDGGTF